MEKAVDLHKLPVIQVIYYPFDDLVLIDLLDYDISPRRSSVANAGGRPFCHELGMGWVHIGQWIFSISAISHALFWRKGVFCVFTL